MRPGQSWALNTGTLPGESKGLPGPAVRILPSGVFTPQMEGYRSGRLPCHLNLLLCHYLSYYLVIVMEGYLVM